MNKKKIERLIYKSLDSDLSRRESKELHDELQSSEDLLEKYSQIESIRDSVSQSAATTFKPFFEERLMNKINSLPKPAGILFNWTDSLVISFRRIAAIAILLLIVLVSYNVSNGNNYSIESLLGMNETSIETAFNPFNNLIGGERQ
jgi:hypothetical protein